MKKIILFVLIIICLLPVLTKAEDNIGEEEVLLSMLETLGGDFYQGDISANGIIVDKFLSLKELKDLGQDIVDNLSIDRLKIIDSEEIDNLDYRQINLYLYDNDKNPITIIISSYSNPEENNEKTYLYINYIKKENFVEINDIIMKIKNIYLEKNKKVEITTCLIGTISGKFIEEDIVEKMTKAIYKINGEIVDEYKDSNLISYTAYTDNIDKKIFAGEDRINLNIALRYNEYDDQTLMWIGTPIITSGY